MPVLAKTIAFWTLKILFAMIAFLVSVVVANTLLSYILPRIFAEAPRRDIYEMPSLNTWVIVGKHSVTFIVSAWAGIFTGQYFVEPHLLEGRSGAKLESKDEEGRPFSSLWQKMLWQNGKGDGDRRGRRAEAKKLFESHTASYIPLQTPSMSTVDPTIQDRTIYRHFGELGPLALNAINDESDGLSQSLADDASQWNPELRLNEIPKQLHPPDPLTPLTLSEADCHKAWLIQQISLYPTLSYDETELNKYIILDFSRQFIPTSKVIEDEIQHLRYQIRAQRPTTNVRICRIFAFREMILFNTVKCWIWMNLHMVG